jgi:cell division protein FtsL
MLRRNRRNGRNKQTREDWIQEEVCQAETPKKRRGLPLSATVLLFLSIAISLIIRQVGVSSSERALAELQSEIERYKAMNATLESQIDLLKSDEYIEQIARNKLGLVMPGEVRYMMVTCSEGH